MEQAKFTDSRLKRLLYSLGTGGVEIPTTVRDLAKQASFMENIRWDEENPKSRKVYPMWTLDYSKKAMKKPSLRLTILQLLSQINNDAVYHSDPVRKENAKIMGLPLDKG